MTPADLLSRAERARLLIATDPTRAGNDARKVLSDPDLDAEARAVALRALALAQSRHNDVVSAERTLRRAIAVAEAAGLAQRAAEARLSLTVVLADMGMTEQALDEGRRAAAVLGGEDLGRLHAQTGLVLARAGRHEEALAHLDAALGLLGREVDPHWRCLVLSNRGALLGYVGRFGAAEQDLRACIELADRHGLDIMRGKSRQNLGFVSMQEGDLPRSLTLLTEAATYLPAGGQAQAALLLDRADAYLRARLIREARDCLGRAIETLRRGGFAVDVAEAQVLLARAQLLDEQPDAAARTASDAAAEFRRQRRPGWTVLADHLARQARFEGGERSRQLLADLRRSTGRLARQGWRPAGVQSELMAGTIARDLGDVRTARIYLRRAGAARTRGSIEERAAGWYATALDRRLADDDRGALVAARAGLGAVDEFAASLGATDLRVHASGWGTELARLGVTMARDSGDPWRYLTWVERYRANALRRRPVRPPRDSKLAGDLAQLRRVTAELATAAAAGDDTRALATEQLRLERAVRDRSRLATGPAQRNTPANAFDRGVVRDALGDRALVEYTHVGDGLAAVTFAGGRCRLHDLGAYGPARNEIDALRFCLHRLARRHGSPAGLAAAQAGLEHAAAELDAMLLAPLRAEVGDRDLVLAPSGTLHALPWPALPSLRGRTLTVVPSATTWLAAVRARRRRADGCVAVAGPGLEHATAEARAVVRHHRHGHRMTGRTATVARTLAAVDGAAVAHIAAHGTFRADNPQFSALDLADGPLTVYDLEGLHHAPRQLVLSACDTALSAVHAGDELMGVTAAFLGLGTASIVASVTPVADDETRTLMDGLHRRLAAGVPPARALAEAGTGAGTLGFVCFGAGT